jgi:hypothetical protein
MSSRAVKKSLFGALQPAVNEYQVSGDRKYWASQSCGNILRGRLNDRGTSIAFDQRSHALDFAPDRLAGAMSKPAHRPNDVMRTRRLFGRHVTAGVHRPDQQCNECGIGIERGQ